MLDVSAPPCMFSLPGGVIMPCHITTYIRSPASPDREGMREGNTNERPAGGGEKVEGSLRGDGDKGLVSWSL